MNKKTHSESKKKEKKKKQNGSKVAIDRFASLLACSCAVVVDSVSNYWHLSTAIFSVEFGSILQIPGNTVHTTQNEWRTLYNYRL